MPRMRTVPIVLLLGFAAATLWGAENPGLTRIERKAPGDRAFLLEQRIPLVAEFSFSFFAYGNVAEMSEKLAKLGYRMDILDQGPREKDTNYIILGLRPGWTQEAVSACGAQLWREENWLLVKTRQVNPACFASLFFFAERLRLKTLAPPSGPPPEYARFARGESMLLQAKPLVQEMVDAMTSSVVLQNWDDIINSAPTRVSTDPGCQAAADAVVGKFQGLCLDPKPEPYVPGYAPNVVGRIEGRLHPENVYVAVAHLDDMPATGDAPGADDNASGSAMVTALGEIMSRYGFENSAVFLAVTGEEEGLIGSGYYAGEAKARGEKIQGVLNGDMIAWQGDGAPVPEDLDLNYDDNSKWLADLFAQLAADYGTGAGINEILCPSFRYSDHVGFWDNGWSAVFGITDNEGFCGRSGSYPYYHTSDDTIANCGDTAFFTSTVKAYLSTLAHLANPICKNPDSPTGLDVSAQGPNNILVSWTPAAGKVSYEIYRAPGDCTTAFPFTKVGETASMSLVDTTASGSLAYAYLVRSRDKTGYCLSCPAPCAEATTTGECYEAPVFSGLASVTDDHSSQCGLTLTWPDATHIFCGTVVTFNVYRSTDPDFVPGPHNRIVSCLSGNTYMDADVLPGITYFYVVRAEDDTTGHGGPCGGNEEKNLVKISATANGPRTVLFSDDFENGLDQWDAVSPWSASTGQAHGGTQSVWSGNDALVCSDLTLKDPLALPAGVPLILEFWTLYNTEAASTGVQAQITTDNGNTWVLLTPVGGYPGTVGAGCPFEVGSDGYSGDSHSWILQKVDLSGYAGRTVKIRFVMVSGWWVVLPGLYIDDLLIYSPTTCGRRLKLENIVIRDSCSIPSPGRGDGILDPEEDVTLEVAARNTGALDVTGVKAVLTTTTPGVIISNDTEYFPDIQAGQRATGLRPFFDFRVPVTAPCGSTIDITVHFSSNEGAWDQTLPLLAGDPVFTAGTALSENFDASGIPPGWTVVDGLNDGNTWLADNSSDPLGCGQLDPVAPISGNWAAVDSDCAGSVPMDEELMTPVLDLNTTSLVTLDFDHYFNRFSTEIADVDVRSSRTGGAWVNVFRLQERTPGQTHETIDISAQAAGAGGAQIRWHYYNADSGLYWYIDNIVVKVKSLGSCVMNPCLPLPGEVSGPGSAHPLLLVKDRAAAACPTGYCMYFEKEPVASGYNVYEGTVGAWYSHGGASGDACNPAVTDLVDGNIRYSLSPTPGDHYYLVTALNIMGEGTAGNGLEDVQRSCPP